MKNFKRFIKYYKPHLGLFIFDTFCSLLVGAINLIYPFITKMIINQFVPQKEIIKIIVVACVLLGVYIVKAFLSYIISVYGHKVGVLIQADMRNEVFEKLQCLPVSYYDENKTGTIMSRIINDLMDISELAHHVPEDGLIALISLCGSFIMLGITNIYLALIVFALIPIFIIFMCISRRGFRSAFKEMRVKTGELNADLENSVSGIRVSKAYNSQEYEKAKFRESNMKFQDSRMKAYHHMGIFHSVNDLFTDLLYLLVIVAGGLFFYYGKINIGEFTEFLLYTNVVLSPIRSIASIYEQLQSGATGFTRIIEILDTPSEIEKENAIALEGFKKNIIFKDVSFKYKTSNDDTNVLNKLNLKIQKGKTLALVGPSGGGKTTICHLIPRFYDATDGEILLDGINVNDYTLSSLRTHIGIVDQDVFLFAGSIKENIAFGNLDATDEEIIEAAKKARIYDYVKSLPDGFDTYVGERGVKLSGGQKQRVAIARAFLKNPQILILDEATSALDNVTELQIQEALEELSKGRTTIVVAHRLSTVKNADEIVVIDENGIQEQGTHDELIKLNGTYANLYALQFRL